MTAPTPVDERKPDEIVWATVTYPDPGSTVVYTTEFDERVVMNSDDRVRLLDAVPVPGDPGETIRVRYGIWRDDD